jgi:hypothetical protein
LTATPSDDAAQPDPSPAKRPKAARIAVQILGFLLGLALLAWCLSQAFSEKNRGALRALLDAPRWMPLAVAGLALANLLFNGLIFWCLIAPARRLPITDVLSVNAIATFLNYLPFKLSVASRFIIHNRRNHVPLLTIGAWMAASAVAMLAVLAPLALVIALRPKVDALWFAISIPTAIASLATLCITARIFAGDPGLRRLHSLADRIPLAFIGRLARSQPFTQLHAGFAMLAQPGMLALASILRFAAIAAQSAQFVIVAKATGTTITWDQAVVLSSVYFLLGVISPAGALGTPQGGTTAFAKGLSLPGANVLSVVTLAIGAVEAVTNLFAASLAVAWLKFKPRA